MHKTILAAPLALPGDLPLEPWLDLIHIARVEIATVDPIFPVEHALAMKTTTVPC
jgi:hypothetical protein